MCKLRNGSYFEKGDLSMTHTKLLEDVSFNEKTKQLFGFAGKILSDSKMLSDLEPEYRIIDNLEDLKSLVRIFKLLGAHIVLTMGTFDVFHVGHARYIRKARQNGSLLIVGLDDDEKARARKGENRPTIPYIERSELLTYTRYADIVAKKSVENEKWSMIKIVSPDILIAVEGTYTPEEISELESLCVGMKVVVLPRQAKTSTSAKVRKMTLYGAEVLKRRVNEKLSKLIPDLVNKIIEDTYQEMQNEED
jgi:D-glycero-beta-D-manno-heptose 1-phosphate adenylyltransferase